MATKTKDRTTDLYPAFDTRAIGGGLLEAIVQGAPIVATPGRRVSKFGGASYIKRDGKKYTDGDVIPDFGQLAGDDDLARRGMVQTKRLYEAKAAELARKKYRRDVLAPLETVRNRAARAHSEATSTVTRLEAELKQARTVVKDASTNLEEAEKQLADALKELP